MQPAPAPSASSPSTDKPLRALVVEADHRVRSLLRWTLDHDQRFRVVAEASNEDEAVACPEAIDVALVDLRLSGLGGRDVIGRLRGRQPSPVVVVLANTPAVYLRDAALHEGASAYLVQPRDLPDLGDHLTRAAAEAGRAAPGADS